MYPIEKYRYFTDNTRRVVAVSTYAGKPVRGVAICGSKDKFDIKKGKELAAARCSEKVAKKRMKRAEDMLKDAYEKSYEVDKYVERMEKYYSDATSKYVESVGYTSEILDSM